jgi:hypothetical protein
MQLAPDAALINDAESNHFVLDFVALAKTAEAKTVDHP